MTSLTDKCDLVRQTLRHLFVGREDTDLITLSDLKEAFAHITRANHIAEKGRFVNRTELCHILGISAWAFRTRLKNDPRLGRRHENESDVHTTYSLDDARAIIASPTYKFTPEPTVNMRDFFTFHPLGQFLTVITVLSLLLTAMAAIDRICTTPLGG